jgi:hypothetical protein
MPVAKSIAPIKIVGSILAQKEESKVQNPLKAEKSAK